MTALPTIVFPDDLDKFAAALAEKKTVIARDIRVIKASCRAAK